MRETVDTLFDRGGRMAARMAAKDWSTTPLGPPVRWPQSLRTAVRILLTSRYAMWMAWGDELTFLCNDAYLPTLGVKESWALGAPAREVWKEIWPDIGPRIAHVLNTGEATWDEALKLFLERSGYVEETYHTFSYSPLADDAGRVAGMLCVVTEETDRVIGERRLAVLRDLAAGLSTSSSEADVFAAVERCLVSASEDFPFTAIYVCADEGTTGRLVAQSGMGDQSPLSPATISCGASSAPWPLDRLLDRGDGVVVEDLASRFQEVPRGPWPTSPTKAIMLPITQAGHVGLAGVFIAGLNPLRPFDSGYRSFASLFAGQLAAGLSNARGYESERRRAEALAEMDRAKTTFFSNISHEFRTPLTLILGPLADILASPSGSLPAGVSEELSVVHRNGLRLLKLVNTLLEFSRIEAGRLRATYVATDVARYTAELASLFRSATVKAGLSLSVDTPPDGVMAYIDRDMWEKIVLNLISNAFKFTMTGGITVRLTSDGRSLFLKVQDTGSGIPADEVPRVFERFHRVEGTRGRSYEGTGIGLALVQELVKLHVGTISVESTAGQGTTFTVTLSLGREHLPAAHVSSAESTPLSPQTGLNAFVEEAMRWLPQAAPGAETSIQDGGRPRIIVADDNADMRDYVRRLLVERYDVVLAADGVEALVAARTVVPSLILSDVMMPKLDGFGLLRAVREDAALAPIPVVLLSARAGEEARLEGVQAGADDYLVKPFSARELLARVEAQIARKQSEIALKRSEERARSSWASERSAREEAERVGRMKDEFLATLSHELRTPLNAILGWSEILSLRASESRELKEGLDAISRSARVQSQMIEDLLDMSRIISGKVRLDVQRVVLADVVASAVQSVRPSAEVKGVRLIVVADPAAGSVAGDPGRLQQVIWNLLSNAIKFTPRGGRVHLVLERIDSHMQVSVSDTGEGIDPAFLPHVFERFRQGDASSTRRHGGLGLGLNIVKQLVELHGGTVGVESPGKGQGSTFTFTLPIAAVKASEYIDEHGLPSAVLPAIEMPDSSIPNLNGLSVLIVDDDLEGRNVIQRILGNAGGASVIAAASAAEALDVLQRIRPAVLVSDVGMPEEDGYDLIRKVRALPPEAGGRVPAVALTAFARTEDRQRALLAGYQMHVAKPVEPSELLTVCASLAGRVP